MNFADARKGMRLNMQEKVKKREKERETRVIVNGRRWAELLRQALVEALWVGCAFLLGHIQMLFGTYPLGLALLCASSAHTVAIFIGVLLSSVMVGVTPVIYICAYAIAAVVRIVSAVLLDPGDTRGRLSASLRRRMGLDGEDGGQAVEESQSASASGGRLIVLRHMISGLFSEHVRLRMTTGAVCALIIALYRVIVGGFQYYDLFASIFVVLVTPAAVMAYSVAVGSLDQHPILKKISWGILLFSAVWALTPLLKQKKLRLATITRLIPIAVLLFSKTARQ